MKKIIFLISICYLVRSSFTFAEVKTAKLFSPTARLSILNLDFIEYTDRWFHLVPHKHQKFRNSKDEYVYGEKVFPSKALRRYHEAKNLNLMIVFVTEDGLHVVDSYGDFWRKPFLRIHRGFGGQQGGILTFILEEQYAQNLTETEEKTDKTDLVLLGEPLEVSFKRIFDDYIYPAFCEDEVNLEKLYFKLVNEIVDFKFDTVLDRQSLTNPLIEVIYLPEHDLKKDIVNFQSYTKLYRKPSRSSVNSSTSSSTATTPRALSPRNSFGHSSRNSPPRRTATLIRLFSGKKTKEQ